MKKLAYFTAIGALTLGANAGSALAQVTTVAIIEWNGPLGYRLRPGAPAVYCAPGDPAEVAKIQINSSLYAPGTMISPEQAKALALCAVPGQLASGEMENHNGRIVYEVDVLPTDKKTYSKVEIDATNGEVINAKQFGGLRGLAGYLRESAERKNNKIPTATTTTISGGVIEFVGPLGYTLRPGAPAIYCAPGDPAEVARVSVKADLYAPGTMISPDQAKALALCAVPGQLASGEMENHNGRTVYEISVLPTDKKTYSKVEIDATTGEVINAKQFGGLRGLAGFLRESAERNNNKNP